MKANMHEALSVHQALSTPHSTLSDPPFREGVTGNQNIYVTHLKSNSQ